MTTRAHRWLRRIAATVALLVVAIAIAVAAIPGARQTVELLWVYNANNFAEDEWQANKGSSTIPFRHDGHVLVQATVQGDATVTIALDTGAPMSALIDGAHLDGLALSTGRTVPIGGGGQGVTPTAQILRDLDLTIGAVAFTGLTALLIPWEQMGEFFTSSEQVYIHGILGYDLFSRYVVEIDFEGELLTLHKPDEFNYTGDGEILPLSFVQRKPYVNVEVTQVDGITVPTKLQFDLGKPDALSLIPSVESSIVVPPGAVRNESRGLSGRVDERLARVPALHLGRYELRDVVTSFSIDGFATSGDRNGVFGIEALTSFRVYVDYPNERLILEPEPDVEQTFEADMSGISWVAQGDSYAIRRIRANSPAEIAGLQKGDELVSIDGVDSADIRFGELVERMRAGDGTEVALELRRNFETVSVVLTLRRRI